MRPEGIRCLYDFRQQTATQLEAETDALIAVSVTMRIRIHIYIYLRNSDPREIPIQATRRPSQQLGVEMNVLAAVGVISSLTCSGSGFFYQDPDLPRL
jgi:molybdenum cofactor biosynthesis enzyme